MYLDHFHDKEKALHHIKEALRLNPRHKQAEEMKKTINKLTSVEKQTGNWHFHYESNVRADLSGSGWTYRRNIVVVNDLKKRQAYDFRYLIQKIDTDIGQLRNEVKSEINQLKNEV